MPFRRAADRAQSLDLGLIHARANDSYAFRSEVVASAVDSVTVGGGCTRALPGVHEIVVTRLGRPIGAAPRACGTIAGGFRRPTSEVSRAWSRTERQRS